MTTITIDPVTRIEGHARVLIDADDSGAVTFAGLVVNELRGFERILVGMEADRMPQVTARICGVCPSAHHLAAAKAIDAAAGVTIPPAAALMRELLYMGHFIHSHAVHLFALAGPDLLFGPEGAPAKQNIVGVVEAAPEVAKKALRLRTIGQRINEEVGGRGVHPVTAIAGGMSYKMNDEIRGRVRRLADEGVTLVQELAPTVKELLKKQLDAHPDLLNLSVPAAYMSLLKDGKPNFYDGKLRVIDETGATKLEFDAADYDKHLSEKAYDWSYMKAVTVNYDGADHIYRAGALARVNLAEGWDTPIAQAEQEAFAGAYGGMPCHLVVAQIHAQFLELVHCCEKAKALADDNDIMGDSRVPVKFTGGRGVGIVEAPRGTLIHDYEVDDKGIVRSANLIVATQQNLEAINSSIQQAANAFVVGKGDAALLNGVEFAIRCYDPCLSCATHAVGQMPLEIVVRNNGKTVRTVRRD